VAEPIRPPPLERRGGLTALQDSFFQFDSNRNVEGIMRRKLPFIFILKGEEGRMIKGFEGEGDNLLHKDPHLVPYALSSLSPPPNQRIQKPNSRLDGGCMVLTETKPTVARPSRVETFF